MKIVAQYDFKGGKQWIAENYSTEFSQIESVIAAIDASCCKTKESAEKTMRGKLLFSPVKINAAFKKNLIKWAGQVIKRSATTLSENMENILTITRLRK